MGSDLLSPSETAALARSLSLEVIEAPPFSAPFRDGEAAVSSTRIRKCLSEGDILAANGMLGYDYSLRGVVVAGNRIGRTIGFPTANMQLYEPLKLVPSNGVYEVEAETLGERFKGMCNIGLRPTVGGKARTIETHILDFDEDIYGHDIRISFRRKIRDEKHFPSLEALRGQLERDRASLLS
jgi:riboflavin kinase/FMN adenylyltransferase